MDYTTGSSAFWNDDTTLELIVLPNDDVMIVYRKAATADDIRRARRKARGKGFGVIEFVMMRLRRGPKN